MEGYTRSYEMIIKHVMKKIFNGMPDQLKQSIRWEHFAKKNKPLLVELSKIDIVKSGCERIGGKQIPFVVLKDGAVLYGKQPTQFEREIYARWRNTINPTITEDTIRVAMDVLLRYMYPHAMPHLTMPYSRNARQCFHPQHIETIEDIPRLGSAEKNELKVIYSPKPGEQFVDVGAYIGMGTVRISKEVGKDAGIIAIEADSDSSELLECNILRNNLSNVTIIRKGVWNKECISDFHKAGAQANSLIDGIVNSNEVLPIETTTIDAIIRKLDVGCIDIISITINGAEVEAVEGMKNVLTRSHKIRLSIAGWYKRGNQRVCDIIAPILRELGLKVVVGQKGGVLAWK